MHGARKAAAAPRHSGSIRAHGVSAASGGLVLRDELDGPAFFLVPARGDR
jgi:hypothetical protein